MSNTTGAGGDAALMGLRAQQREVKADLGDALRDLATAREREKLVGTQVEVYGDRSRRAELAGAREDVATLEQRVKELEARNVELIGEMSPHSRRDGIVIRLQTAHSLSNEQREQLRAELEGGASQKAVEQRAAALASQNATAAGQVTEYAFNAPGGVPW